MKLVQITEDLYPSLETFCKKCELLGYKNNSSFKEMRLEWCLQVGEFWSAVKENEIVAVAGFHPLPEVSNNAWRILYRGCELPNSDTFKGMGKAQWNSITFREFVPIFINRLDGGDLFITTNIDKDHSNGRAPRNHRNMQLMAKQKILIDRGEIDLFNTRQSLWELDKQEYLSRRKKLNNVYVD
jgi:hypothetical protein